MMKNSYSIFAMLGFLLISCSKEIVLPQSLEKLKATYNTHGCACDPVINQFIWRSKTVFAVASKAPNCDWEPLYFYKNGDQFKMQAGYVYDKFLAESRLVEIRWSCQEIEKTR
jgi:hypothetical protein